MLKRALLISAFVLFLAACVTVTVPPAAAPTTFSPAITLTATPATFAIPSTDDLWQRSQTCTCLVLYSQPENRGTLVLKAIATAKKSIRLKIYLLTRDDVMAALVDAFKRGVDVRVLAELNVSGGSTANVDTYTAIKNTGVLWHWASFDFRFTHEKSLVIDNATALIMTHNITSTAFNNSRGYGALDTRPDDVAEIARVFDADWEKLPVDLTNARLVWSPVNARQKWLALIDRATKTLELEQEEWLAPEIVAHVAAAGKRGVKVRVILPPSENLGQFNQEPYYDQVRAVGGEIKFMDAPRMVGKITIVDGQRVLLGSENVSDNSLNNNRELGIIFDQTDAVDFIKRAFEFDWTQANIEAFPVLTIPIPANGIVNWKDAPNFYNRDVTVEGKVVKIYNSGRVMFLQFSDSPDTDMKAVIFPSDWGKFSDRPDRLFFGKTIRVTGRVQKFEGAPEIIVNNPSQIVAVGD